MLSLDHADSSTTGENALPVLEMSSQLSQLRTDSPDNDSAFSDSISLISSEQSSSSSSSNSNKAPNMNSNCNLTSSNNSKPPQAPSPVSNSSSQVIVSASGSESTTPVKQQQLFLESSSIDSDNKDDSVSVVLIRYRHCARLCLLFPAASCFHSGEIHILVHKTAFNLLPCRWLMNSNF